MTVIDKAALIKHIKARANKQASLPAAAVLDGLAVAIERGDFDEERTMRHGNHEANPV